MEKIKKKPKKIQELAQLLFPAAKEVAARAYAPYSHFQVGAALLCDGGEIFTGCNVENRSFGLTNCAERTALFKAVSEGKNRFKAIAIYSPQSDTPLSPCGGCRQVLSEFSQELLFLCFDNKGDYQFFSMKELFPADLLHDLKEKKQ